MKDGWNRKRPGEAQVGSSYAGESIHAQLPLTLGDAVAAFNANPVIRGALPADLADQFSEIKADEWARACGVR